MQRSRVYSSNRAPVPSYVDELVCHPIVIAQLDDKRGLCTGTPSISRLSVTDSKRTRLNYSSTASEPTGYGGSLGFEEQMKPIRGEVDPMAVSPVHPKQSVVAARIESELVLLDVDQGTYFGLDELGTEIWESIS